MKKLFTVLTATLLVVGVHAQSPEKLSYQAVIRNTSNALVSDALIGMQITILRGSATGTVVYTEVQTPNTNANGLVSIEIGGGIGFNTIDWANGTYFLKTEIDPTGGTNYTIAGTSQLLSVPYALHAKTAEAITGTVTEADPLYTSSQAANITEADIASLSNLSGTNTGDQDGSETKITAGTNVTVSGTGTIANPYVINSTTGGAGLTHYIGELYGGGVVFYVDQTGDHGLICSMTDIGSFPAWSNVTSTLIGATAQSDWDGNSNSVAITTQGSHTSSAAKLCTDYTNAEYGTGIFSDWYLPGRSELNLLWTRLYEVQKALDSDGNPATTSLLKDYYWSSSENNATKAWSVDFYTGLVDGTFSKGDPNNVRAIRSF